MAAAASGPAPQQVDQLGAVVGDHVERGDVEPILCRRDDAGLVGAVERDDLVGADLRRRQDRHHTLASARPDAPADPPRLRRPGR